MKVRQLIERLLECDQEAEVGLESGGEILALDGVSDAEVVPLMRRGVTEDHSFTYFRPKGSIATPRGYTPVGPPRPAVTFN